MHVVLAYKPILVDVVFEHVKINSMTKQKIKVQQHNTGKMAYLGIKLAVLRNGLNRAYCSVSARLKCQF